MRLHTVSASVIEMWNGRDLIEFRSTSDGIYSDGNGLSLSSSGDSNEAINIIGHVLKLMAKWMPFMLVKQTVLNWLTPF